MRPFTSFHATPDLIGDYFPRSARIIGGTVFQRTPADLAVVFETWGNPPEKRFAHIVLSLPNGLQLSPSHWVAEFATQLTDRGLPADLVPWVLALDQTTGSEHVHGLAALTTFDGRELSVATSALETNRCHIKACERLGLPVPEYTVTPDRTLRGIRRSTGPSATARHGEMADLINDVFERSWPGSFAEFATSVSRLHPNWSAVTDFNVYGNPSIRLDHAADGAFRPSTLGSDFYPSALLQRMSYCRALKTARTRRILAACMQTVPADQINEIITKGTNDVGQVKNDDHARERSGSDAHKALETSGGCTIDAPAAGSAKGRRGSDRKLWAEDSPASFLPGGQAGIAGNPDHRGCRTARETYRSGRTVVELARGTRSLTMFEWLSTILHHARTVGRFLYRIVGKRELHLDFDDGSLAEVGAAAVQADAGLANDFAQRYLQDPSITPRHVDKTSEPSFAYIENEQAYEIEEPLEPSDPDVEQPDDEPSL